VVADELSDHMHKINQEISDDAFSYLAKLPEEEKKEIHEKFKVNPWKYIFARIEDRYVGRVVLDRREIEVKDSVVVGVGVSGLAVKSDFQKLGVGRTLMRSAISLCRENGIDFMFLNAGEELREYYEKFGFRLHEYKFRGISGNEYLEEEGMILVLNESIKESLSEYVFDIGDGNI
jgi:predicted N-acetyltransferase YhbS